jgi:hypothetical protein
MTGVDYPISKTKKSMLIRCYPVIERGRAFQEEVGRVTKAVARSGEPITLTITALLGLPIAIIFEFLQSG